MIVMSTVSAALVILYYKLRNRLKDFTLEYQVEEEENRLLKLVIDHHRHFRLEQTTDKNGNPPEKKKVN